MALYSYCIDGHVDSRWAADDHAAQGWLRSPDGRRIQPMCEAHAQEVVREYAEKLDEAWTFDPEVTYGSGD